MNGDLLELMKYMVDHKVTLKLGYESAEFKYALSASQYSDLIKKICGEKYDFCLSENEETILIIQQESHRILGYIVGQQDMPYKRGDHPSGVLTPSYYLFDRYLYINKIRIGYISREYQIRYEDEDEIYAICTDKNTLCKCNYLGKILWSTKISLNYTRDLMFDYSDYPSTDFPKGLISISHRNEMFGKYMFYKETGIFYGKVNVNRSWEIEHI